MIERTAVLTLLPLFLMVLVVLPSFGQDSLPAEGNSATSGSLEKSSLASVATDETKEERPVSDTADSGDESNTEAIDVEREFGEPLGYVFRGEDGELKAVIPLSMLDGQESGTDEFGDSLGAASRQLGFKNTPFDPGTWKPPRRRPTTESRLGGPSGLVESKQTFKIWIRNTTSNRVNYSLNGKKSSVESKREKRYSRVGNSNFTIEFDEGFQSGFQRRKLRLKAGRTHYFSAKGNKLSFFHIDKLGSGSRDVGEEDGIFDESSEGADSFSSPLGFEVRNDNEAGTNDIEADAWDEEATENFEDEAWDEEEVTDDFEDEDVSSLEFESRAVGPQDLGRKISDWGKARVPKKPPTVKVPNWNWSNSGSSQFGANNLPTRYSPFKYTIRNTTNVSVRFRLPSGRIYRLAPGERKPYQFGGNSGSRKRPVMHVFSSGKTYRLRGGNHKFWTMSGGRVGVDLNYDR